jgi:16S rRNA (guanine1207-N2)-methyltransferase
MNHPDYINKKVNFNYNKQNLKFNLSQALFSSFSIDAGTNMLLTSIIKETDLNSVKSVLDVGCGVGVIGLTLGKACPNIDNVFLQDRDALAVEFSRLNCNFNQIKNVAFTEDLALWGLNDKKFDLLASNIPAKAGEKVLIDFFQRSGSFLTPGGKCCVVIVDTLADFAESTLKNSNCQILYKEENSQYTVFHYTGYKSQGESLFNTYIRQTTKFEFDEYEYSMDTVYNTPDFDTLGFQTSLGMALLSSYKFKGNGLYVNSGQGHMATYLGIKTGNSIKKLDFAGRDTLRNLASRNNLLKNNGKIESNIYNVPFIDSLLANIKKESLDFLCIEIEPISKTDWFTMIKKLLRNY